VTLGLSEDQRILRGVAQSFLAAKSPVARMRKLRDVRNPAPGPAQEG
jgi:hypothetical protein